MFEQNLTKPVVTAVLFFFVFGTGAVVLSAEDATSPPLRKLDKVLPNEGVASNNFKWNNSIEIKSADDAAKFFDKKNLAALKKQVDFTKEIVVVFGWRGSGQDRLGYEVAESKPEQVTFTYKRGRTRDLRYHIHVFVLRKNVKWSTLAPSKR